MAVKFKSCLFGTYPIVWLILLICLVSCASKGITDVTYEDYQWLTNFDIASAAIETVEIISPGTSFSGKLVIKSQNFDFTILLYQSKIKDNINIDVNGEIVRGIELETVGIYDGIVVEPCCGYKATVKETFEGIDSMFKTANTTYILEPISRYRRAQSDQTIINEKCKATYGNASRKTHPSKSAKHYESILYTASDVVHNFTWLPPIRMFEPFEDSMGEPTRFKRSKGLTECTLHIVADDTFYEKVGHSDVKTTMGEMMYLVRGADVLFRGTDFDGDGAGDNIGFYTSRVTIFTNAAEHSMSSVSTVRDYLKTFSKYDFESYCLGVAFTSTDFEGVLGLAYLASSNIYSQGGICSRRSGTYNFNTNLVTTHTRGKRMPTYTTTITLTHEFGHNFGSPHDEGDVCAPGGVYGNFIMYPYAVDGSKPNNRLFSSCSLNYIYPVLRNKGQCFKYGSSDQAVCGNGIKEIDEECDCGSIYTCDKIDPCCTPDDVEYNSPDTPCKIRTSLGHECSPQSSPCCDIQCKIIPSNQSSCRAERDCSERTFCDGVSAECPVSASKPNGTECFLGSKICLNGGCTGSICDIHGLFPCECVGENDCNICCREVNKSVCSPTVNHAGQPVFRYHGQSCDNRNGFCDGHGECISKEHGRTLDNLHEVFTKESMESFKGWMGKYWYYVLTAVVALVFLIAVFIFTCRQENVHTNAYMHGQYGRIQREAELQKDYLQRRKAETKSYFDDALRKLDAKADMSLTIALTRMMIFFPTAPKDVIMQTLKNSANEEAAVKLMVLRNYPFRRICISHMPRTDEIDSPEN